MSSHEKPGVCVRPRAQAIQQVLGNGGPLALICAALGKEEKIEDGTELCECPCGVKHTSCCQSCCCPQISGMLTCPPQAQLCLIDIGLSESLLRVRCSFFSRTQGGAPWSRWSLAALQAAPPAGPDGTVPPPRPKRFVPGRSPGSSPRATNAQ